MHIPSMALSADQRSSGDDVAPTIHDTAADPEALVRVCPLVIVRIIGHERAYEAATMEEKAPISKPAVEEEWPVDEGPVSDKRGPENARMCKGHRSMKATDSLCRPTVREAANSAMESTHAAMESAHAAMESAHAAMESTHAAMESTHTPVKAPHTHASTPTETASTPVGAAERIRGCRQGHGAEAECSYGKP
jgi:hypothetical protein